MRYLILIFSIPFLAIPAFAFQDGSLYELSLTWQDQNGMEFKLENLKGKPVVLTLAYTKCKTACPLTMQRLRKIDELVANKDLHFVVISLDPSSDTSQRLAEYAIRYKLDGSRWHLLTGSDADVRKLAVILSYRYQKMPPPKDSEEVLKEEIIHSNKIIALNKSGEISAELEGLNSDLKPFAVAVKTL